VRNKSNFVVWCTMGLYLIGFSARTDGQSVAPTPIDQYIHHGWDVVNGSDNVKVAAGYKSNVIGFGWTNGVYVSMEALLNKAGSDVSHPATSQH